MRLLLIRHGQTPSNVLGLLDTAPPGPGLTDLGVEQAAALPATLAGDRIDAIYASTQRRAQLTAEPLALDRGLTIEIRDGLREISAGDLEMLGDDDSIRTYQFTIREWISGRLDVQMPGGPDGAEVLGRFDAVVNEVAERLQRQVGEQACAVLVAHGAVLRLWASVRGINLPPIQGKPAESDPRVNFLHNTGMIVLDGDPGTGWSVVSWMGSAIGGSRLDDGAEDGPAGGDPDAGAGHSDPTGGDPLLSQL
jgi:probable phosphoglycerate mutase